MSELTPIFYLFAISVNLFLGLFVFFKNRGERVNRVFLEFILSIVAWLVSLYLFYTVESEVLIVWVGRFNFAIVLTILYYILKFPFIFPRETFKVSKHLATILRFWVITFFLVTLFTPLVDKAEIIKGPGQRETVYGILYPLYILHYLIFTTGGIFLIFQKLKVIKDRLEKHQLIYFAAGLFISLFFGFLTNILLPLFGLQQAALLGPLCTIIFSVITTYAILKYYLFDIKVLATEFFVGTLGLILLIQGVAVPTPFLKIIDFTILILFLLFGYFLIRSVINEIGYRKKLELAYEELKKLDEAKSEFISIASHQLRTPLSAIKGYISMIIEGTYGTLLEKIIEPLKKVYQANERLIKLVNDLLNLSRIESGKIELLKEKVSIEGLISNAIDILKLDVENKNLYLKFEKPEKSIPKLIVDKEKIGQAIINIVDNAIRYTEKGGITIKISEKKEKENKDKIIIKVKDTGLGMEKKDIKDLFESFSRGTAGAKHWTEGAGLGLYIAKKFIELHNGRVWAESPGINKGSTFSIELPIN